MLLTVTCIAVGLIIVFMAIELKKDQVSMTEVLKSNLGNVEDVEK